MGLGTRLFLKKLKIYLTFDEEYVSTSQLLFMGREEERENRRPETWCAHGNMRHRGVGVTKTGRVVAISFIVCYDAATQKKHTKPNLDSK